MSGAGDAAGRGPGTRPTVWIARRLTDATIERARRDYEVLIDDEDGPNDAERIVEMSARADAIVPCHSEAFDAATVARLDDRLKIVANHSVGVDHCDLEALRAKGVVVTNTPEVLNDATAEIVMLLMLGAARRAVEGERTVRSGSWTDWNPAFLLGRQVTGHRLGILGMGGIGKVVARRARGFDMEVHYHNRARLPEDEEGGAIYHDTLEGLFRASEFLSVNCPSTPATRRIVNRETLAMLPEGAILVNAARGAVVDEEALVEALRSGRLAAAGLDCFEVEPGGNPAFAELDNVFMLPHLGSATVETRDAMGARALDNLDAFFAGREPPDRLV